MLSMFYSRILRRRGAKNQNNGICITNVYISVFGKIKLMTISLVASESDGKGLKYIPYENIQAVRGTTLVKRGFAHMQKHGVIMDVTNVEQAQIAEEAGAVAVMVLDKLPYDVRKAGGVARTASVKVIEDIMDSITIPIMAKCRIGHTMEAKVLEFTGVDMVDESEVLTPADEERHIWKWDYTVPFVNGAEAVTHIKLLNNEIRKLSSVSNDSQELVKIAREMKVPYALAAETAYLGRLPVVNFAAGGISTPADAAFLMNLGCDGVFVGSGIFKATDPDQRARAVVLATTFHDDAKIVAEAQKMVDEKNSMLGLDTKNLELKMQERGPLV